jgi:A/G-specific adenine glycosylase
MEEKIAAVQALTEWFKLHKRHFPWRDKQVDPTVLPYRIWISEVMLQQTRAEVVEPFFKAWMGRFPTIRHLAEAKEGEVIKLWEGLGYYSRAKRLWEAAKDLVEHKKGQLPESYEKLLEIRGFGPYTAGAVASFAFEKKAAAVDGNVSRVIARLFEVEESIDSVKGKRRIQKLTFALLPDKEPWVAMEALIELGALVCRKKPECSRCPFEKVCDAQRCNTMAAFPYKRQKEKIERIEREVALLLHQDEVLISKVPEGAVMAGLYEFPYFPKNGEPIEHKLKQWLSWDLDVVSVLDPVKHSFTRFLVHLYPIVLSCAEKTVPAPYEWCPIAKLRERPFSSGHRKLIRSLELLDFLPN